MSTLKFLGWKRFHDSGRIHRRWEFREPVPELEADPGCELIDRGPRRPERFFIRHGADRNTFPATENVAEALFAGVIPSWRPPDLDLLDKLEGIRVAISGLRFSIDDQKRAREQKPPEKSPEPPAPENLWLRFVREGEYSNTGESFRVYELLRDVPVIPITERFDVNGKPYAQVGDELWQEEDDLTPFQLKRQGKRIGNPEWWQVRRLFEGLDGCGVGTAPHEDPMRPFVSQVCTGGVSHYGYEATADIPGTPVKKGDLVLYVPWNLNRKRDREAITYPFVRVLRSQLDALQHGLTKLRFVDGTHPERAHRLADYVSRSQSRRGGESTVPVLVFRPIRRSVSEPIEAGSDEAALFELIHAAGGRMEAEANS